MDIIDVKETKSENINAQEFKKNPTVIKVVGCGGGGSNAVNRMVENNIQNVEFIVLNTDLQSLSTNKAHTRIPIGQKVTNGLGAGGDPFMGEQAAYEDSETIQQVLTGADMVFITAGMGGGTGTGSAPIVAQIAKQLGCLTVAVVTTPFIFEGNQRMAVAEEGLKKLHENVDSLIVIPNEQLFKNIDKNLTVTEAFARADEILSQGVQGISNIISNPGLVNTDFADVKNAMAGQGNAIFGIGVAEGENRAVEAASKAINNPMLVDSRIDGAKNLLVNICASENVTMSEVGEITNIITSSADKNYKMFWGQVIDPNMGDKISITVIATGFESSCANYSENAQKFSEVVSDPIDNNVLAPQEFENLLNNKLSENKPFAEKSLFDEEKNNSFTGRDSSELLSNEEVANLLKEIDEREEREERKEQKTFSPKNGYVPTGNLKDPAIWSNPEFGRSINLFDD